MAITIPTVDEFTDSTVMLVIREIAEYICGDNGLVAQINNNDITGFTSSYTNNVLKIDATKGDGSTIPVCSVTIEGGSSTGNPYPTGVSGTVGGDGNITFTITMSSGSPITTTINMNYFASAEDLSDLQEQVTGLKLTSSGNTMSINGTSANIVNSVTGSISGGNLTIGVNGINSSPIEIASGGSQWEELNLSSLPTDFVDGDYLIVTCDAVVSCIVSSWTNSPNASGMHITNKDTMTFLTRIGVETSKQTIGVSRVGTSGTSAIILYYLTYVGTANEWNTGSGELFNFECVAFNGASASFANDSVTRADVSTSINKIIRMRL